MHTDRKIGFAMGILLIGIVAALFFRNEPLLNPELPTVRREQELNDRLRERNVAVYLTDKDQPDASRSDNEQNQQRWTLKEVLDNMGARNRSRPSPVGAQQEEESMPSTDKPSVVSPDDIAPVPADGLRATRADDVVTPIRAQAGADHAEQEASPLVVIEGEPITESMTETLRQDNREDTFQPPADFEEYVVKYGDTLSGIALRFLGSQSRYHEIYEANRDRMSSPDRLDVGKPLRIPRVASSDDPSGTY